ncbi:hypothetical protein ACFYUK_45200 [Nonomuraea wenchangensis]
MRTAATLLACIERMQNPIADLLQIARMDAGVGSRHEPVDLSGLVADELDRRPRRVEVIQNLMPGVTVNGEPIALARILTHGGTLTIEDSSCGPDSSCAYPAKTRLPHRTFTRRHRRNARRRGEHSLTRTRINRILRQA